MPAEMKPGYDHPHLAYEAMRLVPLNESFVTPLILLETYEDPLPDWPQLNSVGGGLDRAFPNISRVSTREYGHRVGIFRMLEALESHDFKPIVAIDAMTAELYPSLVADLQQRDTEWVAHGIAVSRPVGNHMTAEEETNYIAETMNRLEAVGITSTAWLGPEYGESQRTPALLAKTGISMVLDWCCDEVPVPMTVPERSIVAYPMNADLDDQTTLINRMSTPDAYETSLTNAVSFLSRTNGRVVSLAMRPWIMGQPFRIGHYEAFLGKLSEAESVAYAGPTEVMSRFALA